MRDYNYCLCRLKENQNQINQNYIYMDILSEGFLQSLFEIKKAKVQEPVLQILGFEQSQNDSKEIIIRLSDKLSYIDCSLIGPYEILGDTIVTSEHSRLAQHFKKFDIIRITQYFFKHDPRKICELVIAIRKIVEQRKYTEKIGRPQEISELVQNQGRKYKIQGESLGLQDKSNSHSSKNKQLIKIQDQQHQQSNAGYTNSISAAMKQPFSMQHTYQSTSHGYSQPFSHQVPPSFINAHNYKTQMNSYQPFHNNFAHPPQRNPDEPLTLKQILSNQKGYFIGKLVRAKFTVKDTVKDNKPLSFYYLGFLDTNGQLVRITLAGTFAIKQKNQLKLGRCYYISQLQSFQTDKMSIPSIKVKDKQSKIHEVATSNIVSRFPQDYYHWQHEFDFIEAQFVDVIGIVDSIQQKTSYKQNGSNQIRQVVRIIIRNHIKTIKVSFWAQQIKNLQNLKLKKGEPIILLDVKKKKKYYLDYTFQSQLIRLSEHSDLKQKFKDFLPQQHQVEPTNIKQLQEIYQIDPKDCKIYTIIVYLTKIVQNRIIYRLCEGCKSKIQKTATQCLNCSSNSYFHKYNCYLEMADSTGAMSCVAFEPIGHIFNKTADQFYLLNEDEVRRLLDDCCYKLYRVGIQNKNQRLMVRNIQPVDEKGVINNIEQNLKMIKSMVF